MMKILPTILLVIAIVSCKTPVKSDTAPADTDSIVIMAKVAKNADLSKIDLSKVVISSQPISLYTKDIEALKKQNVSQDSIILIMQESLTGITALHKKDSVAIDSHTLAIGSLKTQYDTHSGAIGLVKKQSDSLRAIMDTASLYYNLGDFSITNKTVSIRKSTGADTLVKGFKK